MAQRVGFIELDTVHRTAHGAADAYPVTDGPQEHLRATDVRFANLCDREAWTADAVLEAAQTLVDGGAELVVGNCGYMAQHQRYVADRLDVPFVSSSLVLYPQLVAEYGADAVGVVVASKKDLHPEILGPVGIDAIPVELVAGMEDHPHFFEVIHRLGRVIDHDRIRAETLTAARMLTERGARVILIECTLLPPHSRYIEAELGVPVVDLSDCFAPRTASATAS